MVTLIAGGEALESEQRSRSISPMSVSSIFKTSAKTLISTSQVGSVADDDIGKNAEAVSIEKAGQVRKKDRYVCLPSNDPPENQKQDRQNIWHADKAIGSVLSPFAKIFIPRENVQNIWHLDKAVCSVLSPFAKVFTPGENVPKASTETIETDT